MEKKNTVFHERHISYPFDIIWTFVDMYFRQNELTKNVDGVSKNLYTMGMGDLSTIIIMIIM